MATIEQMAALSTPFTTSNGAVYQLPPLNLVTRRKTIAFVELAKNIQAAGGGEAEQLEQLFDVLTELLLAWLGRVKPDLTREQIEEDFDVDDTKPLMRIINGMEQEIESAIPPASSASKKRTTKVK